MKTNDTTICAPATTTGGALANIRISGPEAISIANNIFRPIGKIPLSKKKANTATFGTIVNPNDKETIIDEVVATVFRAPHSYTGEDCVEITCHGSTFIVEEILRILQDNGCEMARPGEFTERAFLAGKMDLSQAEAVADLISSTNSATHRIAISQLRGNISSELATLRNQLLKLTSLLELELDFSDHEELEFADREELLNLSTSINNQIEQLAKSFKIGQAIKNGVPVAIIGKTNVGKSTLLNQILKEDRAIVSDIHGTTRDTIEDTILINGISFRIIDTAGIRTTRDSIEQIGIERTLKAIEKAYIVIWVTDHPLELMQEELAMMEQRLKDKKVIVVQNKIDLEESEVEQSYQPKETNAVSNLLPLGSETVRISAKEGINIDKLERTIYQLSDIPTLSENDIIITSARHYHALTQAQNDISRVIEGISSDLPNDLLCEDLRQALHHLAEITGGEITPQETLNNIFQNFCIGK